MATSISWTDETWNPVHGCSRVSEGCRHCYAERISLQKGLTHKPWTHGNAAENVLLKPHKLRDPYRWKAPRQVFVNSMSDLFHELVPLDYLHQIFQVMNDLPRHRFQVLTKRAERLSELAHRFTWTPNIWMGVSVENHKALVRISRLRAVPAVVRFVSFEPLLESIPAPDLTGIAWAIVGGESGPGHRPMPHAWARQIRDACLGQDVAFFFKQSSAARSERGVALEEEDGSFWLWQQFPDHRRSPVRVPHQINGTELGLYLLPEGEPAMAEPEPAAQLDLWSAS